MYGLRYFPPDAADSADIQQAGNIIVSEGTHEDNRFAICVRKPTFALFLKYLNSDISKVS